MKGLVLAIALAHGGLAAFVGHHATQLRHRDDVPGLAVVVVRAGRVLLDRGYGYANIGHHELVTSHTAFRICSVSKLFTSLAVLQLAREGRLRLSDNVNRDLHGYQLPDPYPQSVTIADLLTFTAGLSDRHIGRDTLDSAKLKPLAPYLRQFMPPVVERPGSVYSYGDYGYALLGLAIQSVSRMPFDRYLALHVFQPLGMTHSTFRQILPRSIARTRAIGYDVRKHPSPAPWEYFDTYPAAGMTSIDADLAKFMIALLKDRPLGKRWTRILEARHYSSYPAGYPTPATAYGIGIYHQNGQTLLEDSGALRGYTSLVTLDPAKRLGIFIAGNTALGAYSFALQTALLDRFFPPSKQAIHLPRDTHSASGFAGRYWSDEYAHTTIEKIRQLINQVQVDARGSTLIAHFWDGSTVTVHRVAPRMFARIAGHQVQYWAFPDHQMVPGGDEVYVRIPWYQATRVQAVYLGVLVLIFVSGLVWLVLPLFMPALRALLSVVPAGISALTLLFLVVMVLVLESVAATQSLHYSWIERGVTPGLVALLTIPLITSTLAMVGVLSSPAVVKAARWPLWLRVHYTLVALAGVALIPFLLDWNLLGYHF